MINIKAIESAEYITETTIMVMYAGSRYDVPADPDNGHYQILMEWVAAGNTITPYVAPPPNELTNEQLIDMVDPFLLAFLKAFAKREGITMQQLKNAIIAEM